MYAHEGTLSTDHMHYTVERRTMMQSRNKQLILGSILYHDGSVSVRGGHAWSVEVIGRFGLQLSIHNALS